MHDIDASVYASLSASKWAKNHGHTPYDAWFKRVQEDSPLIFSYGAFILMHCMVAMSADRYATLLASKQANNHGRVYYLWYIR